MGSYIPVDQHRFFLDALLQTSPLLSENQSILSSLGKLIFLSLHQFEFWL